jgi:hypothetical protein
LRHTQKRRGGAEASTLLDPKKVLELFQIHERRLAWGQILAQVYVM